MIFGISSVRMLRYFLTFISSISIPLAVGQAALLAHAGMDSYVAAAVGLSGVVIASLQLLYYVEAGKRSRKAIEMVEQRDRLIELYDRLINDLKNK